MAPAPAQGQPPSQSAPTRPWYRRLGTAPLAVVLAVVRPVVTAWQVSLLARIVLSTLILGAVVLSFTAWVMLSQISSGLVDDKRAVSLAQAEADFSEVQEDLDASASTGDEGAEQVVDQLVQSLASRSGSPLEYVVVLVGPLGDDEFSDGVRRESVDVATTSVSPALREQVRVGLGTWWTYTTIDFVDDSDGDDGAGIAVGTRVQTPGGDAEYALYYLYPLAEQERTLGLVARVALFSGLLLMVLVAGVAWLVTRQVVTPVRLARRIAERLASGRLEERMQVRGRDDIARLGQSFNQMASSLQRQIRQLEDLSRLQRRFVSDVSHELRTPLTTVRMAAEVLHDARRDFDSVTGRSAELLRSELDRFESLLTDLLEISRFDAGAANLELAEVDLAALVRRTVAALQPVAARQGVTVRVLVEPGPPGDGPPAGEAIAEADSRRVERVVRNLVANAVAHARTDRVEVLVAADDHAAAVAVRDHGIGLRPGEAALVFNRFWRADLARARTGGGTGLGLAIALEDAQLHGGWLQAWGEPERGSQFRLTLPRRAGDDLLRSPIPLVPRDLALRDPARESLRAEQGVP